MTQGETIKGFSEDDLKCDFPVRDSFRESLLSRVLALNELNRQNASSDEIDEDFESSMRADDIDDSELDLLAAAQGEAHYFRDLKDEK